MSSMYLDDIITDKILWSVKKRVKILHFVKTVKATVWVTISSYTTSPAGCHGPRCLGHNVRSLQKHDRCHSDMHSFISAGL